MLFDRGKHGLLPLPNRLQGRGVDSLMDVQFWAATDVGRTRDHNEDNFLVDKKLNLFVVADGMGGHAAGEVASSVAVREVRRDCRRPEAVRVMLRPGTLLSGNGY